MFFSHIDKLILYRSSIQTKNDNRFAEAFLQDSYFKKSPVTYEDVKNTFSFVLDKLIKANICLYYTGKTPSGNQEIIQAYNNIIDMFIV